MANLEIRIDLKKVSGFRYSLDKATGMRYAMIPVEDNPAVFVGKKGIYLNMFAIERKSESDDGQTHFIKEMLPSAIFNTLTKEEKDSIPIIGTIKPIKITNDLPAESIEHLEDIPEE